jgi:DNA-binding GntR family transcriptional regulator
MSVPSTPAGGLAEVEEGEQELLGASHRSLRDVITDAIRQSILSGAFKPGERLVEDRLAADYGVSRNPVREALRSLQGEGLVEVAPRRGAVVARLSDEEAREIIELRAALEGLSARLACRRSTPALKATIAEILERGDRAAAANDTDELRRINAQFHRLLAESGRNRYLADVMRGLRDRTYWLAASTQSWRARKSWQEHAAILRAVAAADEDEAAILAARHVANAGLAYLSGAAGSLADGQDGAALPIGVVELAADPAG